MAKDYVSIRVSTLRGDQKIDFNAYIKIDEKWILYLRNGDSFEGSRLDRLKAKKLKKMYILDEEEKKYRDYLSRNIESAYNLQTDKDLKTRTDIIQGAQQNAVEEVFENIDNAIAYTAAKESAGKYVDFLIHNSAAVQSIISIPNSDQNMAHHGVTVSTLAVAIANKLKLFDSAQTQLMALGALLHDFGHLETSLNISRPLKDFSPEELKIYKTHSKIGAEKVATKNHFDKAVIDIIHQHEEKSDGTGPLGLFENKINPLALVVGAANAIDRSMTFENTPLDQAVKRLMMDEIGKYPIKYIQTLGEILKQAKSPT